MTSESIHSICKGATLIKSFNHIGMGISYNELLKFHDDIASFTVENSETTVPLPSHFDPNLYTTAAFDNFDHEEATQSGIGGSHDTVSILMQCKPIHSDPSEEYRLERVMYCRV